MHEKEKLFTSSHQSQPLSQHEITENHLSPGAKAPVLPTAPKEHGGGRPALALEYLPSRACPRVFFSRVLLEGRVPVIYRNAVNPRGFAELFPPSHSWGALVVGGLIPRRADPQSPRGRAFSAISTCSWKELAMTNSFRGIRFSVSSAYLFFQAEPLRILIRLLQLHYSSIIVTAHLPLTPSEKHRLPSPSIRWERGLGVRGSGKTLYFDDNPSCS